MLDFEKDVRDLVLAALQTSEAGRRELEQMPATDQLIHYINWRKRQVDARPRLVHRSQALTARMRTLHRDHAIGLTKLLADLERGRDVGAYLSIGSQVGYVARSEVPWTKPLSRRSDLDLLLNDWGIHHFHLGKRVPGRRFTERTGPLLFAIVRATDTYAIDVLDHGAWANQHLIEVVVNEWPGENLVHRLNQITGEELSEAERLKRRNRGLNVPVAVGDHVYLPNLGIMSNGVGTLTTVLAARVVRNVQWLQDELERDPSYVHRLMIQKGLVPERNLDLHFEFFETGYGVVERRSGFRLGLP